MIQGKKLDCILLIDDDDATNFLHEKLIQRAEVHTHVQVCNSAYKGLEYLRGEGQFAMLTSYPLPGIIFLDINMPGMNGWDFLQEYDKLADYLKLKVVVAMLTTSLNPDDRKRGNTNPNVKYFITKPLTVSKLEEIITRDFPE